MVLFVQVDQTGMETAAEEALYLPKVYPVKLSMSYGLVLDIMIKPDDNDR